MCKGHSFWIRIWQLANIQALFPWKSNKIIMSTMLRRQNCSWLKWSLTGKFHLDGEKLEIPGDKPYFGLESGDSCNWACPLWGHWKLCTGLEQEFLAPIGHGASTPGGTPLPAQYETPSLAPELSLGEERRKNTGQLYKQLFCMDYCHNYNYSRKPDTALS